ncbi:MAG: hypothetical protein RJQ14_20380, partial [Marinoscillum sp.]
MSNRRDFLRKSAFSALSLPLLSFSGSSFTLEDLSSSILDNQEYWKLIRKQFALKEGQTYFNNGT